jgi:bifunctional DNA-binding transcriptional regulator/antitoxin component of YhaV-PrlF toxin-antitoxin module
MDELFRVRIAAKRQITIPQRMMNVLDLDEGDELQFLVRGNDLVKVVPCKPVPAHLVTKDVAAAIAKSRKEVKAGKTGDIGRLAKRLSRKPQVLVQTAVG